ncbi:tetratricopeptide repeat protein [Nostoc punctiforme FACHB-252]|uniref:Tetratricopeptide repeat protein n=1 Tax=Nostoc punctiforme FACHB-252 TaxID=1357509 RepID=A0ABR8HKA6_NOSPU|nr:tetratricopeptide repeat protein [Nostoc punctiforme FACHB-252]
MVITAVEGMGGVGKTELAIQYSLLHLQLHSYPGGICWLKAIESKIGSEIVKFATRSLGKKPPEDIELPEQLLWCWENWQQGNTLVVFDDVKNYNDIISYLPPQKSQFKVLITTRLKLYLASSLFLEVLSEADALSLLAQSIGEEKQNQELAQAKELCQRLGYLPLALQLVAKYVKQREITLADMLGRLEKKGLGHPSLVVKENDPIWTSNVKHGVAAAFELSWSGLIDDAQQLGCLLSLFANAPIPWSLVEDVAVEQDKEELEDARFELEKLHLLQGKDTYQLHQLIREFFQGKLEKSEQAHKLRQLFCQVMIAEAKKIPDSPTHQDIQTMAPNIPHVAEVIINEKIVKDNTILSDENFCWPFISLSRFYAGQGLYEDIKPWYEKQILISIDRFGEKHLEVASSYNNLAKLYNHLHYYIEAEEYYNKAKDICETLPEVNNLDVATILNNLALLYSSQNLDAKSFTYFQNNYIKAEELFCQALKIRKNQLGDDHPDVAESLNNLGMLYVENDKYEEAEEFLQKALEVRRKNYGTEHLKFAESLNNLAYFYEKRHYYSKIRKLYFDKNQDDYNQAKSLYLQTLSIYEHWFGNQHPNIAFTIWNLGNLYLIKGEYKSAESCFVKAVKILKKCLGTEHHDTVHARKQLQYFRRRC